LEDIHTLRVFAVHPPGKVEQEFLEDAFEEGAITLASLFLFDLVNAPGGPGVDRRVDVAERPLISGKLTVGMPLPLAQEEQELFLCEVWVHKGERDAVKSKIPSGVPGVFPFVWHRNDIGVVYVRPVAIPANPARLGWLRLSRITRQPILLHVVVKL